MRAFEKAVVNSPFTAFLHRRLLLPTLARVARDPVEGPLLEVGCGNGATTEGLLARWPRLATTAIDIDPDQVLRARLRLSGRARVEEGDVTRLAFPSGAFRTVVAMNVLHHVGEYERALHEVHRVLAPGGQFLFTDYTSSFFRGPFGKWFPPEARFAKPALRTALEGAGFQVDVLSGTTTVVGRAVKERPGPRQAAD
ncbi:MAG TPA: class I SAM-dependent methyltransferase [Candidatus Thermoplasmatota archaeon]|nr:class I SAM-dependent methyltransferase [Candidatus Thermoplasmatota archaeon]